jgi:hypothetical protein
VVECLTHFGQAGGRMYPLARFCTTNISYGSSPIHYALQDFRPFLSSFFWGQASLHLLAWTTFDPE